MIYYPLFDIFFPYGLHAWMLLKIRVSGPLCGHNMLGNIN